MMPQIAGPGLQHLDRTANTGRTGEPPVRGQQRMFDRLGESDVAAVVRADVVAQLPHAVEERGSWEHGDRERHEVIDGVAGLLGGQGTARGMSSKDRDDLEPE